MREEREERALRKAEQEATKVRQARCPDVAFPPRIASDEAWCGCSQPIPALRCSQGSGHLHILPVADVLLLMVAIQDLLAYWPVWAQALNMIEHEEDIYARPARTWFQVQCWC